MLANIFSYIESLQIHVRDWIVVVLGIALIRTFIENFSVRTDSSVFTFQFHTLAHYLLFYVAILLAMTLVIHLVSRKPIGVIKNVTLFAFPIVLTPPLIDLFLTGGEGGLTMAYLNTSPEGLLLNFATFFGSHALPGITPGIRVEILLLLALSFAYLYTGSKAIVRSLTGTFLCYITLFVFVSLPSMLSIYGNFFSRYFYENIRDSLMVEHITAALPGQTSFTVFSTVRMDWMMILIFYALTVFLVALFAWRHNKNTLYAFLKNMRPERVLHYFLLIAIGIGIGVHHTTMFEVTWLNALTLFSLFAAFFFAWMFSVGTNDMIDLVSDKITNTSRPLVTGTLTKEHMQHGNYIFFALALAGAYAAGVAFPFIVLTFIALYHVYSTPPLQLKRFAGVNAFIIALCALTTVYAGFVLGSGSVHPADFPTDILILILIGYTLIANVKDIKDTEGDKAVGVYTIPVIFGEKKGKRIIAYLVFGALSLVPLLTGIDALWSLAIPFGVLSFLLIHREPFRESLLFALYFLYLGGVLLIV